MPAAFPLMNNLTRVLISTSPTTFQWMTFYTSEIRRASTSWTDLAPFFNDLHHARLLIGYDIERERRLVLNQWKGSSSTQRTLEQIPVFDLKQGDISREALFSVLGIPPSDILTMLKECYDKLK